MPVLCLFPGQSGWQIENIGNGAALNIVIAQGRDRGQQNGYISLEQDVASSETWSNPIHLRPMTAGGVQPVPWNYRTTGIGISYTDNLGFSYTARMSEIGSRVMERRQIPQWSPTEWAQLGDLKGKAPGAIWAQVPGRPAG